MKTALTELIEKWESEMGSYIPNAPIYKAFIEEAKTFLEKEKTQIATVYVLVKVTYDYYRFQENYGVYKTIAEAEKQAKAEDDRLNILCYTDNINRAIDRIEEDHWWIQEFCCL